MNPVMKKLRFSVPFHGLLPVGKRQLERWSRDSYERLLLLASIQREGGIARLLYIELAFTTDAPERDLWFDDTRAFYGE